MGLFENNLSPYLTVVEQGSTPSTPASGNQKLFVRTSDHLLCYLNSSGTVTLVSAGLTNPLTTTGDIIYSSSGTTAARRAIGSTGQILTVAGGVPTWAAASGGSLTSVSGTLSADVSLTSGTAADGPTVTLTSGTWLVVYCWTITSSNATKIEVYTVLQSNESGTPLFDESDVTTAVLSGGYASGGSRSAIAVLTEATPIVKFRIRVDQSGCALKRDTTAVAGTTHTASRIDAIKIA